MQTRREAESKEFTTGLEMGGSLILGAAPEKGRLLRQADALQ
jgi:hypothetical protein